MAEKELFQIKSETPKSEVIEARVGRNLFTFWNGDKYVGQFSQHKGGKPMRNGWGCYITSDGLIYAGIWMDDNFIHGEIIYPDGSIFEGYLANSKCEGPGSYRIPFVGELMVELAGNQVRTGTRMMLFEEEAEKGKGSGWYEWEGEVYSGLGSTYLLPENHFLVTPSLEGMKDPSNLSIARQPLEFGSFASQQ